MNLLIFGATGTAGAEVVREALKDSAFGELTAVGLQTIRNYSPEI